MAVKDRLILEGARLIFRNFSGNASQYNEPGDRNFCVVLDNEIAEKLNAKSAKELGERLKKAGWNVKFSNPREDEDPTVYLPVKVNYLNHPPRIWLVTKKGRVELKEEEIGMLDWAEIKNADLIINPYNWEVGANKGVKAYLMSLYVTIEEDPLAEKYEDKTSEE